MATIKESPRVSKILMAISKKVFDFWIAYTMVLTVFSIRLALFLFGFNVAEFFVLILFAIELLVIILFTKKTPKENRNELIKRLFVIFTVFWLILSLFILFTIESKYTQLRDELRAIYLEELEAGKTKINASWRLVEIYSSEFYGTYGTQTTPPSRDTYNIVAFYGSLLVLYQSFGAGFNKLIVVERMGNCAEFANAVSFLLNDTTNLPTRVIGFEGVDHAFPEIYAEGKWWVLDKIYTTPKYPVGADEYSEILKTKRLEECVANLVDESSGESVLSEHGFKPVNLTIIAILDLTTRKSDDTPAAGAEVEIFAPVNHYDPLVAKGKTDENGKLSVVLKSQKDYIIIVKLTKLGNRVVGIAIIDKSELDTQDKTIEVYLHKYE